MLKGKHIVLGITGSIAAYKACYIIRGLIKKGAEVQVVITPSGKEFITPITLSALTHKPVISEFFSQRDGTWNGDLVSVRRRLRIDVHWHRHLRIPAQRADVVLVGLDRSKRRADGCTSL